MVGIKVVARRKRFVAYAKGHSPVIREMTPKQEQIRLENIEHEQALKPILEWEQEMAKVEAIVPQAVEDLYDALIVSGILDVDSLSDQVKQAYNNKKTLRNNKPDGV